MSATKESRDERFARLCVERIERVSLCQADLPGTNGAVDYHVLYPGGPAALEVTTLTDAAYREVRSLLAPRLNVTPQRFTWRVTPNAATNVKAACEFIPQLVEMCEAAAVCDPFQLPDRHHPAVAWHERSGVEMKGYETHRAPVLHVLDPAIGGGVQEPLLALVRAVNDAMSDSLVQRKLKKLDASGLDGRQLFLLADAQGLDFRPYYGLAMSEDVPSVDIEVPSKLTHVWMASGFKVGGVLRWERGSGWSRHWPFDNM